jgi:phage repressor protein C with HTH and peptisase S24 domain
MNKVRELRKKLNLSRQEFAERHGVTERTVINWENGATSPKHGQIPDLDLIPDDDSIFSIPYYSHIPVSAGTGIEIFDETQDGVFDIPAPMFSLKKKSKIIILYASGDSMHPYIKDGDGLLVDINTKLINVEAVYVLRWQDTLLVKSVQKINEGIRLISKNPDYRPIELTADNADDLQIIGRVIGSFSKW